MCELLRLVAFDLDLVIRRKRERRRKRGSDVNPELSSQPLEPERIIVREKFDKEHSANGVGTVRGSLTMISQNSVVGISVAKNPLVC